MLVRSFLSAVLCLLPTTAGAQTVDFRRDVMPLLKEHCFTCHQGQKAPAGVRLDQRLEILGETTGRILALPGKGRQSKLIQALRESDPKKRMPRDARPLPAPAIALLEQWIDQGLAWDEKLLPSSPGPIEHWAFQPISRPQVPTPKNAAWVRNPVDAFIAARQEAEGVAPAPEADRRTLIRRLSLDLIGLPPTPEEVDQFVREDNPLAYENLVQRLLSSPHHGERWGRHWLDVARWTESEGYESNHLRLHAWRYRDWVMDSFNRDRPFADFVAQQLAGDELEPYRDEHLVATGFLAAARLSSNEEDRYRLRNDILVDITNTTAAAFLGITLQCAQCHNHKFDPLTARDYYRFQGFFAQGQPGNLALRDPRLWAEFDAKKPKEYDALVRERNQLFARARQRKDAEVRDSLSADSARVYFQLTMAQRSPDQERLAREIDLQFQFTMNQIEKALDPGERDRYLALKKQIAEMEKGMLEPPQTFGFYSSTSPHAVSVLPMKGFYPLEFDREFLKRNQAYLLAGGNVHQPSFPLDPGIPALFEKGQKITRRLDLARWLASPDHPLAARVYVNRLWQWHFGRGLAAGDFGVRGPDPSHPELLDWLAAEFLASGGSTRHLHRLLVQSATYRQASRGNAEAEAKDPENAAWHRWQPRRLEAEAIRDGMLAVSGDLDPRVGGPSVPADEQQTRRTVYLFQKREAPPPQQALFDGPAAMTESCAARAVTTVPLQALYLLNGEFTLARARSLAERIRKQANDPRGQIEAGFRFTLQRGPDERELRLALTFLETPTRGDAALVLFAQTLLNLNEFLYLE